MQAHKRVKWEVAREISQADLTSINVRELAYRQRPRPAHPFPSGLLKFTFSFSLVSLCPHAVDENNTIKAGGEARWFRNAGEEGRLKE